eukprot:scaffold213981_cov51-Attheya_sp.AAC.1
MASLVLSPPWSRNGVFGCGFCSTVMSSNSFGNGAWLVQCKSQSRHGRPMCHVLGVVRALQLCIPVEPLAFFQN